MSGFPSLVVSIAILFLSVGLCWGNDNASNGLLQSQLITDRGEWGDLATCSGVPFNQVVVGFQLKVEYRDPLSDDNTALNGIWFACGNYSTLGETSTQVEQEKIISQVQWITSSNAEFGEFRQRLFCNQGAYAKGFQLKSQQDQGPLLDDVGAVNLKMICSDGEELEGYEENQDNYDTEDEYTEALVCGTGMGVCGIQTQVEEISWEGDNTALNNIRIQCCPLPNLEKTA